MRIRFRRWQMSLLRYGSLGAVVGMHFVMGAMAWADPPWASLIPFKKVESTPNKPYLLTEEQGPWLILAACFAGRGAEKQAHELVMELRQKYRLPAYVHKQTYDYTEPVLGLSLDRYGERQKMRYANHASKYDAYAVVIGNYNSIDDPSLSKVLQKVKYARPECLDITKHKQSTQRFIGLRELYKRVNGDPEKRNKGPMGNAFATRNPLLPEEYFAPTGLDNFVISLNRNVEHSLLNNPGRYTVRVAGFQGNETTNAKEIKELESSNELTDRLELAADRAHRLTVTLRGQGVEAYEFHDRYESIVTVGSFDHEGTELPDGRVEINPGIFRVMEKYRAKPQQIPGRNEVGLVPQRVGGIPLDVQPLPIPVPRQSIGSAYVR